MVKFVFGVVVGGYAMMWARAYKQWKESNTGD